MLHVHDVEVSRFAAGRRGRAQTRAGAGEGDRILKGVPGATAPRPSTPRETRTETLNYFIGKANETRAIQCNASYFCGNDI